MVEHSIALGMPNDIRTAAQSQAEREGLHWTDWIARAVRRELARSDTHEHDVQLRLGIHHSDLAPRANEPFMFMGSNPEEPQSPQWRYSNLPSYGEGRSFGVYGLGLFSSRIDQGALLLSAAFIEAKRDFLPRHEGTRVRRSNHWLQRLVVDCRDRSDEVRQALLLEWEPTGRAAELAIDAFKTLSALTQTSFELQRLCQTDRPRAFAQLARHLELATQQFELNAKLVAEVEGLEPPHAAEPEGLGNIQNDILRRAGGGLSLTEAAKRLQLSRQGLHKRVKSSAALAVMHGKALVFPLAQWTVEEKTLRSIAGLPSVLNLFEQAGGWSALQFLIEHEPNLGTSPRLALIAGRVDDVISAAEAHLGLEEDE